MKHSPFFNLEKLNTPVFIVHGKNDPRVQFQEAEEVVQTLKQKQVYFEYLLFEDEGHGITKPENRLFFYEKAELFLAKYLGGDCEIS